MVTPLYSCIIIDDDEIDRLTTMVFARKYPFLNIIGVFSSATEALAAVKNVQVDVMLSDIDMPDLNGLEFRAKMMNISVCIFISAYPDYAAESFEMEAFDFLVKPLKHDRFEQSMNRLQNYFELKRKAQLFEYSLGSNNTVFIKDGHEHIKLNLHDIVYLEALKDYTRIVTTSKKYSVLVSIGNLLMETAFQSFLRIHRSYAVQRHYIDRITSQEVFVQEFTLPIGRSYKDVLVNLK
ncbi:LytTR family DNA-binding domain-containing protein [Dyadobacter sp. CY312]|uniref:LytR/AlgR family response regulator transcription factor n=1 Tax=Dyadobacter sp. CY312 TaxID=2907303 RepID=UPI001F47F284|nr:LytTR family DNA-binding domain-containing protein [Dyadobacter sp. CY312]MCE7042033.1 LytTR family DNA-binding domain-containing protein [Dyadobacter sp. CY312]